MTLPTEDSERWLPMIEVARRCGVERQTAYNWRDKHEWETDEQGRVRESVVHVAKVLTKKDVLAMGAPEERLSTPGDFGVEPRDGRFSLADVDRLKVEEASSAELGET